MNEQIKPPVSTHKAVVAAESPRLPGEIGHLGENLAFHTDQRDQASGIPVITSVWKPELITKAQAVADGRGVALKTIVQEWEAVWAANG